MPWRRRIPGRREHQLVRAAGRLELELEALTSDALRARIDGHRERLRAGIAEAWPALPEVFALIREATRRALGMRLYDVQLLAGAVLVQGMIAEVATGEGKTLIAALPAIVHGLRGEGAHVATVNAYLAARDFEQLLPVFGALGLEAGLIDDDSGPAQKRAAYAKDITYATGYAFGFDYLRDQLSELSAPPDRPGLQLLRELAGLPQPGDGRIQRPLAFALVDEVDSVLIDEARTPLVIAGAEKRPSETPALYRLADEAARELEEGLHYAWPSDRALPDWTPAGESAIERFRQRRRPRGMRRPWRSYVEQACRARQRTLRDIDYIVVDGEVVIVDESTGRPFPDRSWQDGLHQAVEVVCGVTITAEQPPLARITRQRYFLLYEQLAGMTGTAETATAEFRSLMELDVALVPTHKPSQLQRWPDRYFIDETSKLDAIAESVAGLRAEGRPVLIGTRTIQQSERCATTLSQRGVTYALLNAKQDAGEAEVIGRAGEHRRVTIATNMAGRGAHIPIDHAVERLGGLHVIGFERHESSRIDRQLIGRAGRQGQRGSSQFMVSLEDELFRHEPRLRRRLARAASPSGELRRDLKQVVAQLQRGSELKNLEQRRALVERDEWMADLLDGL